MSSAWPHDPDTRDHVARLLWQHLPEFYRVQDQPPRGEGQLREFLAILAAPLAAMRQRIEEQHADLFIDTCGDQAIALFADLLGARLVFPDADSNRRDVRGTVGWRRRKGTPSMLDDMARELADQLVSLQEGWRRLALTQDLDILRLDRQVPDLRSPLAAETHDGPLDRMNHVVDLRSISARGGRYHPAHVVHWLHTTMTWPVIESTARFVGQGTEPIASTPASPSPDPDWRYAIHPLGHEAALRARAIHSGDPLASDRIHPMHFVSEPGRWFGRPGRFTIRINSVPAAVADPQRPTRTPSDQLAEGELVSTPTNGSVELELLAHTSDRWSARVAVGVYVVKLAGQLADPNAGATLRGELLLDASGSSASASPVVSGAVDLQADEVIMLELSPQGVTRAFFPGATVAITGGRAAAALASSKPELAREGSLRGAVIVEIPEGWVTDERWYYLGADGGLVRAQLGGEGPIDVALVDDGGELRLDLRQLASTGIGSAWPPLETSRAIERLDRVPSAAVHGPTVLHGASVLAPTGGDPIAAGQACALVFAAQYMNAGVASYRPFVRLEWTGPDPRVGATWKAITDAGADIDLDERHAQIAQWCATGPSLLRLVVRFESAVADARMAPGELTWTSHDGRTTLVHLPELSAALTDASASWDPGAGQQFSEIVEVGEDGSTWAQNGGLLRVANGDVAPLPGPVLHTRRQLRWRRLCPWRNETAQDKLPATPAGTLDVDVEHGLFALAPDEPPQPVTPGPGGVRPPNVTVDFEDAATGPLGARPTARELEPGVTRVVCRSGARFGDRELDRSDVPRYASLDDALYAIESDPAPANHEVVQFEDSATYHESALRWPNNCDELTIQVAEGHRVILELSNPANDTPLPSYAALRLRGLGWRIAGTGGTWALPEAGTLELSGCSMLAGDELLALAIAEGNAASCTSCLLGAVAVSGAGTLSLRDCGIDTGLGQAAAAVVIADGRLELERSTVIGTVSCLVLEASEVLFVDDVDVGDRFRGCVRYSAVTGASVLPRRHRVSVDPVVHFGSADRHDPAHLRLSSASDASVRFGAEDGSEIGVFHDLHLGRRRQALGQRLTESIPAGLTVGIVNID